MHFPPKFSAELDQWQALYTRPVDGMTRGQSLAHYRHLLEMFRALYARWRLRLPLPEQRRRLEDLNESFAGPLEKMMDRWFAREMQRVLDVWESHRIWSRLVRELEADPAAPSATETVLLASKKETDAPAADDPAAILARARKGVAKMEPACRRMREAIVQEWPERAGRRWRERFEGLDEVGAKAWRAELDSLVAELEAVDQSSSRPPDGDSPPP